MILPSAQHLYGKGSLGVDSWRMQSRQLYLLLSHYVLSEGNKRIDSCHYYYYANHTIFTGLLLTPPEKAVICEGELLELTCLTNTTFLGWKTLLPLEQGRTHSYLRYIFAMDETEQASSYNVNSTSFNASRISSKDELPLVSRIVINPVTTDLNGTEVNCTVQIDDAMNNANFTPATTTIYVLGERCM